MRNHQVEWSERREASEAAKRAMLERMKPKPAVQAAEIVPFAERTRVIRPRKAKRTYELVEPAPVVIVAVVVEAPKPIIPHVEPVRYSVDVSDEFSPAIECYTPITRRKSALKAWRLRQWHEGNRDCTYCRVRLTMPSKAEKKRQHGQPIRPTTATVDHLHPLSLGGDDAPWNWGMCCAECNNKKGSHTEAEFRAKMSLPPLVRREIDTPTA